MVGWIWLVVGFLSSAIMLHIATLLLLDEASLIKAIAVAASVWLVGAVFVLFHLGGGVPLTIASLVVGCGLVKHLYGVGFGPALAVFLVHGLVEIAIALLLWFMFPNLVLHQHRDGQALRAGSGCHVLRT